MPNNLYQKCMAELLIEHSVYDTYTLQRREENRDGRKAWQGCRCMLYSTIEMLLNINSF